MRIISGKAKSRRLAGPKGMATRPMTDRAKEGIFSAIAGDIPGAVVLDLYAGSGSLGLEALSRGAASAVFVEYDRQALHTLRTNVETVGLEGVIEASDVARFVSSTYDNQFDLVFVDPPYDLPLADVNEILGSLSASLTRHALVIVHRRLGEPGPQSEHLVLEDERSYGTAQIWRYRMGEHGASSAEEHTDTNQTEEMR